MIRDKLPKCRFRKFVGLLAVVAVLVMACPVTVAANGVEVSIPDADAEFCDTVSVPIRIDNLVAPGLGGATIDLEYDNGVVEITNVADGDLMGVGYTPLVDANLAGKITLAWFYLGMPPGPTGDLVLANITLHALGSAGETSALDLSVVSLYDASPASITPTVVDGVFTVLGEAIPPTVVDKSPTGSNVPIDTLVTATFSEAMEAATIDETSFTLAGSTVSGTVSYDAGTFKATFTPDADLDYDHEYTATLSTDITDVADNPLAAPYSWSFTTERAPDVEIQVAMLLDSSGSVSSGDFGIMTVGLADAVEDGDCVPHNGSVELTVVRFGLTTSVVVGPVVLESDNYLDVADDIRNIAYSGGGTPIAAAFDVAADALVNSPFFSRGIKQAINLVTDGYPNSKTASEAARNNAIDILDMTENQDEIDAEAVGTGADVDWMRDEIVYPQPGYVAPPFDQGSGWVRVVENAEEFAATICEKFEAIIAAAPNADFSASPRRGVAPLRVEFTDESTGDIDSWAWDFGDGSTSTERNPTHTYTDVGRYDVSLEVTGPGGSDTEEKSEYIIVREPEAFAPSEPANFAASYLRISPEQVLPDQQVEISINISNTGGERGSHTVALYINGYAEQSQTIGVSPDSSKTVVFRVTKTTPGTYQVSVEGALGQFTVLAPAAEAPTAFGGPLGTGGIIAIVVVVIVLICGLIFGLRRE